jgi:Putative serine esterase (DUF676)
MNDNVYDFANRMHADFSSLTSSILDQLAFPDSAKEGYKMMIIRCGRQQSILILVIGFSLLVVFLGKLSFSFTLGKENKGKLKSKGALRFFWTNRKTEFQNNSSNSDDDNTFEVRNDDEDSENEDDDDNSQGSNSSNGSAFASLRRAPELVRQNLAQLIKKVSWDELSFWSPLYMLLPEDDMEKECIDDMDDNEEFFYGDHVVDATSSLEMEVTNTLNTQDSRPRNKSLRKDAKTITHFCFLVHGHRGMSRDLCYMQSVMRKQAKMQQRKIIRTISRKQQRIGKHVEKRGDEKPENGELQIDLVKVQNSHIDSEVSESSRHSTTDLSHDSASDFDSDSQNEIQDTSTIKSRTPFNVNIDQTYLVPELVVHSPQCNEKKTDDGVVAGGDRLVDEILTFIRKYMLSTNTTSDTTDTDKLVDITISLVGNSFGGLYSRYAVAKLAEILQSNDTSQIDMILDGRYRVHFNVFCTTATPHLGLAGHTYVPLPRSAEVGVAAALGDSGRDLFRLNSLLMEMATTKYYLSSLGYFRKRIAYANAYGTDFPVPTRTAAFLSEASTYPHHFDSRSTIDTQNEAATDANVTDNDSNKPLITSEFVVAKLHTKKDSNHTQSDDNNYRNDPDQLTDSCDEETNDNDNLDESVIELATMSASLDSLGWTKVFVDVRKQIPRIAISQSLLPNSLKTSLSSTEIDKTATTDTSRYSLSPFKSMMAGSSSTRAAQDSSLTSSSSYANKACIHQLKEKGVVPSKDVAAAVAATTPLVTTDRGEVSLQWPLGHNMMVAFSRSKWSAYMNKAGRPVVDSLARELVDDIFAFRAENR